ncbi:MAG TPA: hypothetical protein VNQ55_10630 [Parapedobacter sp.]|nr:hypothetical protein [Parapedobacter sp.]
MKSIYLLIGIAAITLFSCDKAPQLRLEGVPESVTQLIDDNCFCDPRIGLFKWDGRSFYVHWVSGPACDGITSFFDEQGNPAALTIEEQQTFWEEKELVKMVWVCGK